MAHSHNVRGIAAMLVAMPTFVANDSCMKPALSDAPPFQVLVMRGGAACLWCLPVIAAIGCCASCRKPSPRMSPARVVAPFSYSMMIWATVSGLLVFGDVPNMPAIAGMALILAAGLAVILLEGRTRQGAPAVAKP